MQTPSSDKPTQHQRREPLRWMAAAALLLAFLSICCVAQAVTFLLAPRNQRSNLDLRSKILADYAPWTIALPLPGIGPEVPAAQAADIATATSLAQLGTPTPVIVGTAPTAELAFVPPVANAPTPTFAEPIVNRPTPTATASAIAVGGVPASSPTNRPTSAPTAAGAAASPTTRRPTNTPAPTNTPKSQTKPTSTTTNASAPTNTSAPPTKEPSPTRQQSVPTRTPQPPATNTPQPPAINTPQPPPQPTETQTPKPPPPLTPTPTKRAAPPPPKTPTPTHTPITPTPTRVTPTPTRVTPTHTPVTPSPSLVTPSPTRVTPSPTDTAVTPTDTTVTPSPTNTAVTPSPTSIPNVQLSKSASQDPTTNGAAFHYTIRIVNNTGAPIDVTNIQDIVDVTFDVSDCNSPQGGSCVPDFGPGTPNLWTGNVTLADGASMRLFLNGSFSNVPPGTRVCNTRFTVTTSVGILPQQNNTACVIVN